MGSSTRLPSSLPQPMDDPDLYRTFAGYRMALARMTPEQLLAHLTSINAALAQEAREATARAIYPTSGPTSSLDSPVGSMTMEPPSSSPMDRGARPSLSRPPSPLELLSGSRRLGPRLAARLVAASAAAQARRSNR